MIILSGGPNSVHVEGAPQLPDGFFEYVAEAGIPLLGICYGMQLMVHALGGKVQTPQHGGEYGRTIIRCGVCLGHWGSFLKRSKSFQGLKALDSE